MLEHEITDNAVESRPSSDCGIGTVDPQQTELIQMLEERNNCAESKVALENKRLPKRNRRKIRQPRRMKSVIKMEADGAFDYYESSCSEGEFSEAIIDRGPRRGCSNSDANANRNFDLPKVERQPFVGISLAKKSKNETVLGNVAPRRGRSRPATRDVLNNAHVPLRRSARRRCDGRAMSSGRMSNDAAAEENDSGETDSDELLLTAKNISKNVTKSAQHKTYPCYICDREFPKFEMEEHLASHKSDSGMASDSYSEIDRGSNAEEEEEPEDLSCEGASEELSRGNEKRKRRRKLASDGLGPKPVKKIPCEFCGALFSKRYMPNHRRIHTGEKPFTCDECLKPFSTKNGLQTHMTMLHSELRGSFQCDICQQMYSSKQSLRYHKNIHSDENPHQCSICGKAFKQLSSLCNHTKTHSDVLPYQCDVCGKRYKGPDGLSRHRQYHHEGIRLLFPCEECGKSFTRRTKLKDHLMWHRGTSPYVCSYCGKRLMTRKTLRTHELIHEDKKPYKCSVCQKGFRQSHVLKRHMSVHTGVKPFSCDLCKKQFIHRVYLVRHKCEMAGVGVTDLPNPDQP